MKKALSAFLTLAFVLSALSLSATNAVTVGAYSRGNEEEPNNDPQHATAIEVNASYDGSLSSSSDADWYVFTISQSGTVCFNFVHDALSSSSAYWLLTVYDAENYSGFDRDLEELMVTNYAGNETNTDSQLLGLKAGTYYVKIACRASYTHSSITYTLTTNFTPTALCEIEGNDNAANASSLTLDKSYLGSLDSSNDVDWFKFTLSQSGTVCFNLVHDALSSSTAYWLLTVYDAENYSGFDRDLEELMVTEYPGNETNTDSQLLGLKAGTYYVKIACRASYTHSSITYTLTTNFTPTALCEIEGNDNAANASSLTLDKSYLGSLDSSNDVDWFKFTLNESKTVYFNLAHDALSSSSTYWQLTVYDAENYSGFDRDLEELMVTNYAGNETSTDSQRLGLRAGTYYVKLACRASYTHSSKTYTLTVTDKEPVADDPSDEHTHVYDDEFDPDCNVCGESRVVPILGDVNGDGEINNIDATVVLQYDAGAASLEGAALTAADVNGDHEVNNIDATRILQFDSGIIAGF